MNRIQFVVALFILAILISPVAAQTWSVNAGTSTVLLQGDVEAWHEPPVQPVVVDSQTENTFQTPFVDLLGDNFDIGQNMSASAQALGVAPQFFTNAAAGGYVKATLGSSFDLQWRSAVSLELRGDADYFATGDSSLASHIEAELSGLNPGTLYKVFYDWSLFAGAIEDHEGQLEDREFGSSTLDFTFGTLAFNNIMVNAGPSSGFMATDGTAGGGVLFLNAGTTAVSLVIDILATAEGELFPPPINASPPVDSARPEALGRLTLRVEAIIPEPSSVVLALLGCVGLAIAVRRKK